MKSLCLAFRIGQLRSAPGAVMNNRVSRATIMNDDAVLVQSLQVIYEIISAIERGWMLFASQIHLVLHRFTAILLIAHFVLV